MPFTKNFSSRHVLALTEEALQCGYFQINRETTELILSFGLQRLLGLQSKGTYVSLADVESIIHPDDRHWFDEDIDMIRSGTVPPGRRFRVVRSDGTIRHVSVTSEALTDRTGQLQRLIGIARDVTMEEALHAARANIHSQLTILKQGLGIESVWTTGPTGHLLDHFSTGSLRRTNETMLLGQGWLETVHPDDRQRLLDEWSRSLLTKSPMAISIRILCEDGQARRYLSRISPQLNSSGDVTEWRGVFIKNLEIARLHDLGETTLTCIIDLANGALLKAARGALGWTVEELAHHASVSRTTIRRMEGTPTPLVAVAKRKTVEGILGVLADNGVVFIRSSESKIGFYCLFSCP